MGVVRDYVSLTKPRVISLLLVTALGGMFLGANGVPSLTAIICVMIGGYLGAGGANAINHYLDRDIDDVMFRTKKRPVPGNRILPIHALLFGLILNVLAFAVLAIWANVLSASLVMLATLIYVFVYTIWLKRVTPQNIVIGGAAGAIPPMVGWAAVTGTIGLPALYLFAIIFFWTPAHFWALSIVLKGDYARAGVPMLSVVSTGPETIKGIFLYSLLTIAITLMFFSTAIFGWLYLWTVIFLSLGLLYMVFRLHRSGDIRRARQLYFFSMFYLAAFFVVIMVESVIT